MAFTNRCSCLHASTSPSQAAQAKMASTRMLHRTLQVKTPTRMATRTFNLVRSEEYETKILTATTIQIAFSTSPTTTTSSTTTHSTRKRTFCGKFSSKNALKRRRGGGLEVTPVWSARVGFSGLGSVEVAWTDWFGSNLIGWVGLVRIGFEGLG